jgi:hypothetical protein
MLVVRLSIDTLETASLNSGQNLLVDGDAGFKLSRRQVALTLGILREIVFPIVEQTSLVKEHDRVGVEAFVDVLADTFYGRENQIRAQSDLPLSFSSTWS